MRGRRFPHEVEKLKFQACVRKMRKRGYNKHIARALCTHPKRNVRLKKKRMRCV